jgi:hypothetical protein
LSPTPLDQTSYERRSKSASIAVRRRRWMQTRKTSQGIPSSASRIQLASGWSSHTKYRREKVGRRVAETAGEVCQGSNSQNHARNCALCASFRNECAYHCLENNASKSSRLFFALCCGEYFLNPPIEIHPKWRGKILEVRKVVALLPCFARKRTR